MWFCVYIFILTCCHQEVIIDSRVINIMNSTSQDGGEDFKIGKDRLK